MPAQPTEIEVEVVEIDGHPTEPKPQANTAPQPSPTPDWKQILWRLPKLWWPLKILLGILAVVLLLTVGLVAGLIYLAYRLIRNLLQVLTGESAH